MKRVKFTVEIMAWIPDDAKADDVTVHFPAPPVFMERRKALAGAHYADHETALIEIVGYDNGRRINGVLYPPKE